ncbi:MAG: NUDIX hydrolase [Bdellovibrionota bacterium]
MTDFDAKKPPTSSPAVSANEEPEGVTHPELWEKVVTSDLVYKGMFLKVVRDKVLLPSGGTGHREYILHPGAALIVPVLSDGRFVLVEQYRHAMKKVFLEFPAGKIDKGEDPMQCAHRELQEETGYTSKKLSYLTVIHPVIGYANEKILIYVAEDLTPGPQNLDEGEELKLIILSEAEIEERLLKGEFTDAKSQAAFFWWQLRSRSPVTK